jgi:hypothetical protein
MANETQNNTQPATPAEFKMPTGEALTKMSYAELEEIEANHLPEYLKVLPGLVKLAKTQKALGKEIGDGASFYGKVLCIELRRLKTAKEAGLVDGNRTLADYVKGQYGVIPARAFSAANVFSAFCLAPETSARYVSEKVYGEITSRMMNDASKITNTAKDIKGETPETSGLGHPVFTEVANVLRTLRKTAVEALENITARLVEIEDGDTKKLTFLSTAELAARNAKLAAEDTQGELYRIVGVVGIPAVIALLLAEARMATPAIAEQLCGMGPQLLCAVAAATDTKDGQVVPRFDTKSILEWNGLGLTETMTEADAKLCSLAAQQTVDLLNDGFNLNTPETAPVEATAGAAE